MSGEFQKRYITFIYDKLPQLSREVSLAEFIHLVALAKKEFPEQIWQRGLTRDLDGWTDIPIEIREWFEKWFGESESK